MQVIPSIDILQGKTVRLTEGDFGTRQDYAASPREMAERFAHAGARELHVVDLEGAKAGRVCNWSAIGEILGLSTLAGLQVQVGGGLRQLEEAEKLIAQGARRVVVGSLAARDPKEFARWVTALTGDRICVALDLKDGQVATHGWIQASSVKADDVITRCRDLGVTRFLSTDIRRDGKLQGPNLAMYRDLATRYPTLQWISSGGVSSLEDIRALSQTGVYGTVVGKAFYEGKITPEDALREFKPC